MTGSDGTELYRLLIQEVRDYAIFALDTEGVIMSWNDGARRLKGYLADEAIGRHFSMFYPPEDRDVPKQALGTALAHGTFEGEGWRVRKDGSRFWANVIITRLTDDAGRHIGFAKVTRDLTERRAAEERRVADAARVASQETARRDAEANARELRHLVEKLEDQMLELEQQREELQALAEEAEEARTEADSANEAKSLFLAVTSHELRTPINAIIGYTDLMADEVVGPLNEIQRKHITRVRMSARHLLALIENVLTLSRVEAGRESPAVADTDLCAVTRDSVELLSPAVAAKGLLLDLDIPDEPCRTMTDATKVRQILVNLLSNAVKFTDRGQITLTLTPDTDLVRIDVRDTGVGIAPLALSRVFETYWRAEPDRPNPRSGTGLGLSVAKRLADILGGTLEVESVLGVGSIFRLGLPKRGR